MTCKLCQFEEGHSQSCKLYKEPKFEIVKPKMTNFIDKEYERNIREAEQRGINWNNPELLKARLDEERKRLIETIEKEMPMGQELATSIPLENRSNPIGFLCEQREKVGFNSYRAEVLKILEALKSQK